MDHFAVYQPCIPEEIFDDPVTSVHFNTDYVKENLLEHNKGHLFGENGSRLFGDATSTIVPSRELRSYDQSFLQWKWTALVLEAQLWLLNSLPSMHQYSQDSRAFWHDVNSKLKKFSRLAIREMEAKMSAYDHNGNKKAPV
jgi:hypothetical protein